MIISCILVMKSEKIIQNIYGENANFFNKPKVLFTTKIKEVSSMKLEFECFKKCVLKYLIKFNS
jgi:hypothetical protein